MILTMIQLHEGEELNKFYGVAWRDYMRDCYICYPVPFNWVMRWGRSAWLFLCFHRKQSLFDKSVKAEVNKRIDRLIPLLEAKAERKACQKMLDSIEVVNKVGGSQ